MSKVAITKSKLDTLANAIAAAASTPAPLTIDQMTTAAGTLVKPVGTKQITANGTGIDVAQYASVDVTVPSSAPTLETVEHVTPTESSQTITPHAGYDALSSVQIDPISSTYVGSGITRRSSTDLTASGDTVTVPAGYYETQSTKAVAAGSAGIPTATKGSVSNHAVTVTPSVSNSDGYISGGVKTGTAVTVSASELVSGTKTISASGTTDVTNYASASVAAGSATTPATSVTANPSISVSSGGLITATASATKSVTPTVSAGYVGSGTAGTITVSGSNTQQLTTQAAATITPTKSSQTAVAAGRYTTGAITVAAIPAAYQDVTGVTAAAGDVVSGKDIVSSTGAVVHGFLVIQHYYTGSSAPSSSLGVDGDIYLQTS